MQLPDELFTALTAQMNREQANQRFYLAAANRFETLFYTGFAKLMESQAKGEGEHAEKVRGYLVDRNTEPLTLALQAETLTSTEVLALFKQVLSREVDTSRNWTAIYQAAMAAGDVPTIDIALWFMREQVEEERLATEWLGRVNLANGNSAAMLVLDGQAKGV